MTDISMTDSDDETATTRRFLEQHGLDASTPIDPASLQALKEIIMTPKHENFSRKTLKIEDLSTEHGEKEGEKEPATSSLLNSTPPTQDSPEQQQQKAPPVSILRPAMLRVASDLTQAGGGARSSSSGVYSRGGMNSSMDFDAATDASVAGSTRAPQMITPTERIILDQLEAQTALLLDMQRRLDELSEQVMLSNQQNGGFMTTTSARTTAPTTTTTERVIRREIRIAGQENAAAPRNNDPVEQDQPHDNMTTRLYNAIVSLPSILCNSRIAKITSLFIKLQRRQVHNNIDGGFILKLFIMVALIMAKLNSKNKTKTTGGKSKFNMQFYAFTILIIVGFLIQSGYGKFIYNFFVKEKYHERIWNGEDIDPDHVGVVDEARGAGGGAAAQQQQQQDNQQPQRNFLQGAIPVPRNQQHGNNNNNVGIADAVWDFVYLLLSFVLSIFPMWKIEGPPPARRVEQQQQVVIAAQDEQGEVQGRLDDDEPDLVDEPILGGDEPEEEEEEDEIYRDD